MSNILRALDQILEDRKAADADSSYVASLYQDGLNKILEKVGEEATEAILAAKDAEINNNIKALVYETADLWFHSLVMLHQLGANSDDILTELERRFNHSGLVEKANRQK